MSDKKDRGWCNNCGVATSGDKKNIHNWLVNEDKNEIKYYVEAIVEEGIAESKEFKFKGKKLIDAPQK
ncbi:MAG: hypothetical protein PHI84_18180, partial [Kiritimatiellae bacterium]|nr:hypothetical protein [Kiritimatiellia bacterium]